MLSNEPSARILPGRLVSKPRGALPHEGRRLLVVEEGVELEQPRVAHCSTVGCSCGKSVRIRSKAAPTAPGGTASSASGSSLHRT